MEKSEILKSIITTITQTPNIEKIILFGSRARGDEEARSDFDIAIFCPKISERQWLDLCERVENIDTLLKIDLIRLDTASQILQDKIAMEGVIVYEQN